MRNATSEDLVKTARMSCLVSVGNEYFASDSQHVHRCTSTAVLHEAEVPNLLCLDTNEGSGGSPFWL